MHTKDDHLIPAVGTRIRLIAMPDDPDPVPSGSEGTVTGGNKYGIWIDWDNGRALNLIPGVDRWVEL